MPVGAHSGSDFLQGTHLARETCTEIHLVFVESQARPFILFFFPLLFLAREQSNKIIIIIIKRHNQSPLPF